MLRLEFSAADLGRVRVASSPHPMWELVLSINSLQSPQLPPRYWSWRADIRDAGRREAGTGRLLTAATALVPASGNFPDFLTPPIGAGDVETHLDTILSLPQRQLREDLSRTFKRLPTPPPWARNLYQEARLEGVVTVLRRSHALLVEPARRLGVVQVEAERARYARLLLDGGTDRLLENLHPSVRWRNSVLEGDYPMDWTIRLEGRGLVVTPTHFCWGAPVTFIDPDQPPMLVVPTEADNPGASLTAELAGQAEDSLGRLLGATRARMLGALRADGRSTTELANRLDVTQAAVSQHAKVLREAKLIVTARFGPSVRHALTPLGRNLLQA
jgi:DNA-binding transcriptional ArsR family regulator